MGTVMFENNEEFELFLVVDSGTLSVFRFSELVTYKRIRYANETIVNLSLFFLVFVPFS